MGGRTVGGTYRSRGGSVVPIGAGPLGSDLMCEPAGRGAFVVREQVIEVSGAILSAPLRAIPSAGRRTGGTWRVWAGVEMFPGL